MPRRTFLDPDHENAIRTDGYLMLDLLDPADVGYLLDRYAAVEADHPGDFAATAIIDNLACRRQVYQEVGAILQRRTLHLFDDYRIALANFVAKRPASELSTVAVHQDFTFIEEGEQAAITLWCPLVDVNAENGWLGVLPGSHRFNPHYRAPGGLPYPGLIDLIEERYLKYLPMLAGQMLFMDTRLFHGSPRNRSGALRVVAGGVAVPRESRLLYCHRDFEGDDRAVEVYEVPEDFYLRHNIGERPQEGRHVKTVPWLVGELTEAQLQAHWETVRTH
jgi:Phytanoyl-CoA dioxygenase (PhyH)